MITQVTSLANSNTPFHDHKHSDLDLSSRHGSITQLEKSYHLGHVKSKFAPQSDHKINPEELNLKLLMHEEKLKINLPPRDKHLSDISNVPSIANSRNTSPNKTFRRKAKYQKTTAIADIEVT